MNKVTKLSITLLITAFTISLHAQFNYGVRSAMNISIWNSAEVENAHTVKNITGYSFSGFAEFNVYKKFSVQAELQVIQKGHKAIEDDSINIALKLNYIQLPVNAKFNFGNEKIDGFILAGPFVGLMTGGNRETCVVGGECFNRRTTIIDRNPRYERLDYGLSFGGGVKIKDLVIIDMRYEIGLHAFGGRVAISESLNRGLQIGVGYIIGSKEK